MPLVGRPMSVRTFSKVERRITQITKEVTTPHQKNNKQTNKQTKRNETKQNKKQEKQINVSALNDFN